MAAIKENKMKSLTVIYKLGNFKTGKVMETESKSAMQAYVNMGYKLITVSWLNTKEYLDWFIKK